MILFLSAIIGVLLVAVCIVLYYIRKYGSEEMELSHFLTAAPQRNNSEQLGLHTKYRKNVSKMLNTEGKILISGIAGIGKTYIAREIYYELESRYDYIAWIPYSKRGGLRDSIIRSFTNLKSLDQSKLDKAFARTEQFLLNADRKTALFIDDVPEGVQDDLLQNLLNAKVTVLMTSRQAQIGAVKGERLDFLSENECVNLFYSYYSDDPGKAHVDTVVSLVRMVSCNPLFVELLAKGVETGQTLEEYHQLLVDKGFGVPDLKLSTDHAKEMHTIYRHLPQLFKLEELEENSELVRILQNFAVMPGGAISSDVKDWIGCDLNDLQTLVRKGWLKWDEDASGYVMHDVVRMTVKLDAIPDNALSDFIDCVADEKFFADFGIEHYTTVLRKIEIAEAVLSAYGVENEQFAIACHQLAVAMNDMTDYDHAMDWYQRALEIKIKVLGENHLSIASTYNNMGIVCDSQCRYTKALDYYGRALDIYPKDSMKAADIFNNMGAVYARQMRLQEALEQFECSLRIYSNNGCEDSVITAHILNNMGLAYESKGQSMEALAQYANALKIYLNAYGENHPDTATTYNNIGVTLVKLNRHKEAAVLDARAYGIWLQRLGPDHSYTMQSMDNLHKDYNLLHPSADFDPWLADLLAEVDAIPDFPAWVDDLINKTTTESTPTP